MTTEQATHCPRCEFPLVRADTYPNCISCGWEDYGTPINPDNEPKIIPCPGARRPIILTSGDKKWGYCPACGKTTKSTPAGFTPSHGVMSDRRCNGSERGIVRIHYRVVNNTIIERGCPGCGTTANDQKSTMMHRHFLADSPKAKRHLVKEK